MLWCVRLTVTQEIRPVRILPVPLINKTRQNMNENINLCELLKGHEGETFYSPLFGKGKFKEIDDSIYPIIIIDDDDSDWVFTKNGKFSYSKNAECLLFPSKDQRDWNKWAEEQKPRIPKTWSQLKGCNVEILAIVKEIEKYKPLGESINKSVLALLKIRQLIEVGYGGNITNEEWNDNKIEKFIIVSTKEGFKVDHRFKFRAFRHIAFHTAEQANDFLAYLENVQLIRDFYMI